MKNILIITDYYRPGFIAGGPIKSIYNISKNLSSKFNIFILTRNHDMNSSNTYPFESDKWISIDNVKIFYSSDEIGINTLKYINFTDFDTIYFNSFFSLTTIKILKKLNKDKYHGKILLSPRGELSQGALNIKKAKKLLYIKIAKIMNFYTNIIFIGSSKLEVNDILKIFPKNKTLEISNLSETSDYQFINNKKEKVLNMFFLSRISKKKNLSFLLESLYDVDLEVNLKIIGPEEDEEYTKECKNIIKKLPNNISVKFIGPIAPQEIYDYIKDEDYFILPTLNENYGHVISEALVYKKPVILSNNTPWTEYIIENDLGEVEVLEKEKWTKLIIKLANIDKKEFEKYEKSFEFVNENINHKNQIIIKKYKEIL